MWQLHDPHFISEPILVISGLTYLIPAYAAFYYNRKYDTFTNLFLLFTTVGFHSTRNEYFFILDCVAIVNFILRTYAISYHATYLTFCIYHLAILYSLFSYFVGMKYKIMSFHPDWYMQMGYHSLMHITTSYSAYLCIKDREKDG
jgi:hypothetical protein